MRYDPGASSAAPAVDRRSRKRLATRQAISDTATRLFHERGFDQVTVDDIAAAADVGRKTVFNHFARKEDMFFDLDEAARANLREWLENREKGTPVIESLRDFAHHAVEGENPYIAFCPESRMFVETMLASEALKARARGIRDEVAHLIATTLAAEATEGAALSDARLAAGMLLATWTVALTEAYNDYASNDDASAAATLFHNLIDKGTDVIVAMSAPA